MRYEYKVSYDPMLRPHAKTPGLLADDVEWWLNEMDKQGWEYVGNGQKFWVNGHFQTFWVFRRERKMKRKGK